MDHPRISREFHPRLLASSSRGRVERGVGGGGWINSVSRAWNKRERYIETNKIPASRWIRIVLSGPKRLKIKNSFGHVENSLLKFDKTKRMTRDVLGAKKGWIYWNADFVRERIFSVCFGIFICRWQTMIQLWFVDFFCDSHTDLRSMIVTLGKNFWNLKLKSN